VHPGHSSENETQSDTLSSLTDNSFKPRALSGGIYAIPHPKKLVHHHRLGSGFRYERLRKDRGTVILPPPLHTAGAIVIPRGKLFVLLMQGRLIMAIVLSYVVVRHRTRLHTINSKQPPSQEAPPQCPT